jgi:hypothetical protein
MGGSGRTRHGRRAGLLLCGIIVAISAATDPE